MSVKTRSVPLSSTGTAEMVMGLRVAEGVTVMGPTTGVNAVPPAGETVALVAVMARISSRPLRSVLSLKRVRTSSCRATGAPGVSTGSGEAEMRMSTQ
jgi:hypothetical protein